MKYSYYWLDSEDKMISGWDNAPHHQELENFPHHRHERGKEKPSVSFEIGLEMVFRAILREMRKR